MTPISKFLWCMLLRATPIDHALSNEYLVFLELKPPLTSVKSFLTATLELLFFNSTLTAHATFKKKIQKHISP